MSLTTIIITFLTTQITNGEYYYGDHISQHGWSGATHLQTKNGITSAANCEIECENYSGSTACNNWSWRSSNNRCVLGSDGSLTDSFSAWTSGVNTGECFDVLTMNCTQNTICNSYSNDAFSATGGERTLTTGGDTRCYRAYVPNSCKNNQNDKCRIVLMFGAFGKTAENFDTERSDFTDKVINDWTDPGIVIFLQQYPSTKSPVSGDPAGWQFPPGPTSMCTYSDFDDFEYVSDVLDDLETNSVYWSDIFLVGHSQGGHFVLGAAEHLKADHSKTVKAIVSYAGLSLTDHGGTIIDPQTQDLNIMLVHGYDDAVHGYDGYAANGCNAGRASARDNADWWGDQMGCNGYTVVDCHTGTAPNCVGSEGEKEREYDSCDTGASVTLVSSQTQHAWPSIADTLVSDFLEGL